MVACTYMCIYRYKNVYIGIVIVSFISIYWYIDIYCPSLVYIQVKYLNQCSTLLHWRFLPFPTVSIIFCDLLINTCGSPSVLLIVDCCKLRINFLKLFMFQWTVYLQVVKKIRHISSTSSDSFVENCCCLWRKYV